MFQAFISDPDLSEGYALCASIPALGQTGQQEAQLADFGSWQHCATTELQYGRRNALLSRVKVGQVTGRAGRGYGPWRENAPVCRPGGYEPAPLLLLAGYPGMGPLGETSLYLALLTIRNFRRLKEATIQFRPGLNVIVGPNNVGKTALVDALRALLAGADDPYPNFTTDDVHLPKDGKAEGDITFEYVFQDLSPEDEADFMHGFRQNAAGKTEVVIGVTYGDPDKSGRLRSKKWCGELQDISMTSTMLDNLRSVYLKPLRDAEQNLRPSRHSQLSRLMHLLADDLGKEGIVEQLKLLDAELKKAKPLTDIQKAISTRHSAMLGDQLAQALSIELSGTDFTKMAARLSLLVNTFEIERNGLGYNNLIFMAVVLSELAKNADAAFRSLIVEEPEAHLHPQLQAVLLQYLSGILHEAGEKPVQVFVTSHSPNFASIAKLDSVICLVEADNGVQVFHPRSVKFEKGQREKLERYLDVTRAELFFARRAIFVEGAAELMMVSTLARVLKRNIRDHGVSLISVEGLNFDCFMPLFGKDAIRIPVALITDADPVIKDGEKNVAHYPDAVEQVVISDNTAKMKGKQDDFLQVFHGQKTFEYDLALLPRNRSVMLAALKDIHPIIADELAPLVAGAGDDAAQAKALFCGMFERKSGNVQKGKFAQALAAKILDEERPFDVPACIAKAIDHACKK